MGENSFCWQLGIRRQNNIPLTRFNTDSVNPYLTGNYTKTQLDMRRKTEILKYSANKSSTQTNSLTANQKFALLVRGRLQPVSQSTLAQISSDTDCESDQNIPTPTSSCGVPGPIMYLQYDNTIPLYNYAGFNIRSYPNYVQDNATQLQFVANPDVVIDTVMQPAYYLIINRTINQPQQTYNIVAPIGLAFSGIIPNTAQSATQLAYVMSTIRIRIVSAELHVYYNTTLIKSISALNYEFPDLSFNLSSYTARTAFNARQNFGVLRFNELTLLTLPDRAYSFMMSAIVQTESSNLNDLDAAEFAKYTTFRFSLIANIETMNAPSGYYIVNTPNINTSSASIVQIR